MTTARNDERVSEWSRREEILGQLRSALFARSDAEKRLLAARIEKRLATILDEEVSSRRLPQQRQ